ncbi:hypothetical protein K431DRAFT_77113 [Polychaeton citri CBS 116435]|uniref:Uncharacterized protein n=1 Tax=Polychaeton citri CBS 116435 TaxID=1314669 RepID=A0A9P4Q7Y6_9PEZI|nr:hypothetical protein K431DRAFT_77113 [Polychaeton citri CBS 116435]
MGTSAYDSMLRNVLASIAKLLISHVPIDLKGSEGRYSVFPIWCGQQAPEPSPYMDTHEEWCDSQARIQMVMDTASVDTHLSSKTTKLKATTSELLVATQDSKFTEWHREAESTGVTPSPQQTERTRMNHNIAEHERHQNCEAQVPLCSIWLDLAWRKQQPESCIMDFMALAGERDPLSDHWVITMLMLLQENSSHCQYGDHERVQVMDTNIEQERWLKAGAETINVRLI